MKTLFLLFLFPTIVSAATDYATLPFFKENALSSFELTQYALSFFVAGILPYFYFFRFFYNRKLLFLVSFTRYFFVFFTTVSVLLTANLPNDSILLTVFDTNFKQAFEFFVTLPMRVFVFTVLFFGIWGFLARKAAQEKIPQTDRLTAGVLFAALSVFAFFTQSENNLFHRFAEACLTYRNIKEKAAELNKNDISAQIAATLDKPEIPRTIVVAIGESENGDVFRKHLESFHSLFRERQNGLIITEKAETTAPATMLVVKNLLLHAKEGDTFNLLNVYNRLDFKTYWLSNHLKSSRNDDMIYVLTSPVRFRKYYNYFDFKSMFDYRSDHYDNILVDGLKDALTDDAKNKLIFIHLFGSHNYVQNRYPDNFHSPLLPAKEKKDYTEEEHYMNAAAYTNTVLAKLTEELNKTSKAAAFVYFSDHGDIPDNPYQRNFSLIKDIPLFFHLSEKYRRQFPDMEKVLKCFKFIHLKDMPYILNRLSGINLPDIRKSPEMNHCFTE